MPVQSEVGFVRGNGDPWAGVFERERAGSRPGVDAQLSPAARS